MTVTSPARAVPAPPVPAPPDAAPPDAVLDAEQVTATAVPVNPYSR